MYAPTHPSPPSLSLARESSSSPPRMATDSGESRRPWRARNAAPSTPTSAPSSPPASCAFTRLPAPVPSPSPWLGFQARRLLRRTRTLLSIVSLCPDRSSWSSSATGKDAAAGSPTLLLPSEEEAKKKIYNVSCERYFGFGCEIDEETSNKLEGIPGVLFVLPDSYVDPEHKDYGAELFVNGEIVQRSPERQRRVEPVPQRSSDRPRYTDRTRYARRRENQQQQQR